MSWPASPLFGSTAASGQYRVVEDLWDGPSCGRYRGVVASGEMADRPVLFTTFEPALLASAARAIAPAPAGVAPVLWTGALEAPMPVACAIEAEPAGRPLVELAAGRPRGALIDAYRQVAEIAAAAHEAGAWLGGLRPELVYAVPAGERLRVTGIARCAVAALAELTVRDVGSRLPFDDLYEPFELIMRAPEPRSDVFVIAASLARLVGGQSPFGPGRAAFFAIAEGRATPVGPDDLWSALAPALSRQPADRPSAAGLRARLAALSR